ncbi:hypothetical protein ACP70R_042183 [Stipagrostis hirtigluma subsp. patula]
MASDDGGKLRGFPLFLTTVRYVVAAVVTVLAVIVVVMVITVALRPEDVRLSILRGYIEASDLWQVSSAGTARTAGEIKAAGLVVAGETVVYGGTGYGDISVSVGSRGGTVAYEPAASVGLVTCGEPERPQPQRPRRHRLRQRHREHPRRARRAVQLHLDGGDHHVPTGALPRGAGDGAHGEGAAEPDGGEGAVLHRGDVRG